MAFNKYTTHLAVLLSVLFTVLLCTSEEIHSNAQAITESVLESESASGGQAPDGSQGDAESAPSMPRLPDISDENDQQDDQDECDMPEEQTDESASSESDEQNTQQNNQASAPDDQESEEQSAAAALPQQQVLATISDIIVVGNSRVSEQAILARVPFRVGDTFDPHKTKDLIENVYDLNRFRTIKVMGKDIGNNEIELYVLVQEKLPLKEVIFRGNSKVAEKEIKEKLALADVPAIDEQELKVMARKIKKLYEEKNYHHAVIKTELKVNEDGTATAIFAIHEDTKSLIKRVSFIGNNNLSSKTLRGFIFTREDWLLNILDKAGTYSPERLEADKHILEQVYQNHGYINAKVVNVDVQTDPRTKEMCVTFEIEEGDCYTICNVTVDDHNILRNDYLLEALRVKVGDRYSRENVVESIKALEFIWGEFGYIYAHIDPSIQPNDDDKTVSISFHTELGSKVFLNKINIIGNKKTRDKVIRRRLTLQEGGLVTQRAMEDSKNRVESLGYFEARDGANWKTTRVSENLADLDLIVKEVKTGRIDFKLGFGGSERDISSVIAGLSVGLTLSDTNLFGTGIQFNLNTNLAKNEKDITFSIQQPWMFDRPIHGGFDFYHKRTSYDEVRNVNVMTAKSTGATGVLGCVLAPCYYTQFLSRLGFNSMRYENPPVSTLTRCSDEIRCEHQCILDRQYAEGDFFWLSLEFSKDDRNHPIHTSRGYKWYALTKLAFPSICGNIGFYKFEWDGNWYTPLIGEQDLVLRLHGHAGYIAPFKNRDVPYPELYNIGGPASVRGFLFGQIGPRFLGDPIGAQKAFFVNVELLFPITPDLNMKGSFFYDGGAGWDNPYIGNSPRVIGNHFNYRHAVGFGIRMLNPTPIRVDWGFKLDPDKKLKESSNEVHFGMSYDF